MIESFGGFIMQGNVVIGVIVFGILVVVNFVVITKGSGRIAEVAARFSLDAMPGKQMAIDADLSAGLIDEATARERRRTLEAESAFFGAMDGAAKFVRGDAVAGLLITAINLVGGLLIGVAQMGVSFGEAAHTYTLLTVGDGLVSQIPGLIVSIAAGPAGLQGGRGGPRRRRRVRPARRLSAGSGRDRRPHGAAGVPAGPAGDPIPAAGRRRRRTRVAGHAREGAIGRRPAPRDRRPGRRRSRSPARWPWTRCASSSATACSG